MGEDEMKRRKTFACKQNVIKFYNESSWLLLQVSLWLWWWRSWTVLKFPIHNSSINWNSSRTPLNILPFLWHLRQNFKKKKSGNFGNIENLRKSATGVGRKNLKIEWVFSSFKAFHPTVTAIHNTISDIQL